MILRTDKNVKKTVGTAWDSKNNKCILQARIHPWAKIMNRASPTQLSQRQEKYSYRRRLWAGLYSYNRRTHPQVIRMVLEKAVYFCTKYLTLARKVTITSFLDHISWSDSSLEKFTNCSLEVYCDRLQINSSLNRCKKLATKKG